MRALAIPRSRVLDALPLGVAIVAALGAGVFIPWAIEEEKSRLLILVAFAALSPVALRWPVTVAFGAYAFVLPFDSVAVVADMGGATISRLVGMGASAALLAAAVVQRRFVRPPIAALWAVLFLLWGILTVAWAVDSELVEARLITALSLVAMYLAAVSFKVSQKELDGVFVLLMLGGAVAALAGVVMGFEDYGDTARGRGTLALADRQANPNRVATSLILPLAAAIGMFFRFRSPWVRGVAVMGMAAIAAGIFLTMSRAALLAVLVMGCILLYRFRVRWQIGAVFATLAALVPLMPERFFQRIEQVLSGVETTGAGRTEIWSVALNAVQEFGLFGAGLSNFPAVYNMYAYGFVAGHNTFLTIWVEAGIVGLALLLAFIGTHLRMARIGTRNVAADAFPAAIEAAGFGLLIIAMFGDTMWHKVFWMTWILCVWVFRARLSRSTA